MKYSFSAISSWVNCPNAYYECYVLRKWYKETKETKRGNLVHKELEDYILGVVDIPPDVRPCDDLLDVLRALPDVYVEAALAVDRDGLCVPYDSPDCVLRGKIDVLVGMPDIMWVIDWKTGKRRDNTLQAAVYGVLVKGIVPNLPVKATFDYLDKGRDQAIHHSEAAQKRVWELIKKIEEATEFPCKPSGLCGWCGVETCVHKRRF